jgi:mutator protein MutT
MTRIRVAALIIKDGKILLVEHEKGGRRYWLLPGGGVEYGESVEEALKRELQEEVGIEIAVHELLWLVDSIPADRHRHVLNLILSAEALTTEIHPHPDEVLRDARWMDLHDLPNLELFPDTKDEILRYAATGERGTGLLGKRWK